MFITVEQMNSRLADRNNLLFSEPKIPPPPPVDNNQDGIADGAQDTSDLPIESEERAEQIPPEDRMFVSADLDKMNVIDSPEPEGIITTPHPQIIHERCGSGRTAFAFNRTDEERKEIAELAAVFGPTEASRLTGCSISQAHSYAKGYNTTDHRNPNAELGLELAHKMNAVKNAAIDKILLSLGLIDEDKLNNLTPVALSQVAGNIAKIPSSLSGSPSSAGINQSNAVNVVVYSPAVRDENKYKTIEISG